MPWSPDIYLEHAATTTLVLVRVGVLVGVAPILGPFEVPLRVRILVAVALAALLVPLEAERAALRRALSRNNNNVSLTAQMLGISRATLHRKINRLGLHS